MDMSARHSRILIIDDDNLFVDDILQFGAGRHQWKVCHTFDDAPGIIQEVRPDLVLLDIGSPEDPEAGFKVLAEISNELNAPPIIMLTAAETRDTVVKAINGGACDYVSKGDLLRDSEVLFRKITHQLDRHRNRISSQGFQPNEMIVVDPASKRLQQEIGRIAPTPFAVLLYGETGTGKELIAKSLHRLSSRENKPMRAINCAAIPDDLLESMLFGCVPGAFTGATAVRTGEFELARGGTLFLDEIGAASLALQNKLLRVLETGDFQPLGSTEILSADIRLITATNRDPQKAMKNGSLLPDFYYRVSDYELYILPLRERTRDILPLAYRFLMEAAAETGRQTPPVLTSELEEALINYEWPGNARQLRKEIRRVLVQANHREIGIGTFFAGKGTTTPENVSFPEAKQKLVDDFEKRHAIQNLSRSGGNVQEAANLMSLTRQHLHRIINKHNLDLLEFRSESCTEG